MPNGLIKNAKWIDKKIMALSQDAKNPADLEGESGMVKNQG
jgi:hypothetical protein